MAVSLGIDFGTSKTCVAVFRNQAIDVIPNENDNRTTPCFVGFGDDEIHIGETAKDKATVNMKNTIHRTKRLLGCVSHGETVKQDTAMWGFDVIKSDSVPLAKAKFHSEERQFHAEEVSAMILRKMKEIAEMHLETLVEQAVISVPACFNDAQRTAVMNAGSIAGFSKVFLVNEPTAAAIAYNFNGKVRADSEYIFVFDMGAGTFDVSICKIEEKKVRVIASRGNAHFGGDDFDSRMVEYFANEFQEKHGVDISSNKKAKCRLRYECEKAKRLLSASNDARIQLDFLSDDNDFRGKITRDEFEEINKDLFDKIKATIKSILADVTRLPLQPEMIEQVILVGGSSRIPMVRKILTDLIGENKLNRTLNADEAVAIGAAILAHDIGDTGQRISVQDISHSFYVVDALKREELFKASDVVPQKKLFSEIFLTYPEGPNFQIFENTGDEEPLLGTFRRKINSESELRVDENGIFVFDKDVFKFENSPACVRMTEDQVDELKVKAESLRNENNKWLKRNVARNDLEKYVYTIRQNASKNRENITSEQIKQFRNECDKTLEWIETNKSAEVEEYDIQQKHLQATWKSILSSTENQRLAKLEEKQKTKRTEFLKLFNKVEEDAKNFCDNDMAVKFCEEMKRWISENKEASVEEYQNASEFFGSSWDKFKKRHSDSRQTLAKVKAEELRNENNEKMRRNVARNDLEKFVYTIRQNASKHHEIITSEQIQQFCDKCDKTLEWIETNESAEVEEYDIQQKHLQATWESVLTEHQRLKELERKREQKTKVTEFLKVINEVEEDAKHFSHGDKVVEYCKQKRRWISENKEVSVEEYQNKCEAFKSSWDNFKQKYSDSRQTPEVEATKEVTEQSIQGEAEPGAAVLKVKAAREDTGPQDKAFREDTEQNYRGELKQDNASTSKLQISKSEQQARTEILKFTAKVIKSAKKLPGRDELLQYCTTLKEWIKNTKGISVEKYDLQQKKLEEIWKQFQMDCETKKDETGSIHTTGRDDPRTAVSKAETGKTHSATQDNLDTPESKSTDQIKKVSKQKYLEAQENKQTPEMASFYKTEGGQRTLRKTDPKFFSEPQGTYILAAKTGGRAASSGSPLIKGAGERPTSSKPKTKKEALEEDRKYVIEYENKFFERNERQLPKKDRIKIRKAFENVKQWLNMDHDHLIKKKRDAKIQELKEYCDSFFTSLTTSF